MKAPLLILALFLSICSNATIRLVPAQYSTIQSALNACASGDTVMVSPGVYYENIVWPGNTAAIKLLSAGDQTNTTIDGNHAGIVISISSNDALIDSTTLINGFRIRNGYLQLNGLYGYGAGAGLNLSQASPKITNCSIRNNQIKKEINGSFTAAFGAGVYAVNYIGGNLIMRNVEFINNSIDSVDYSSSAAIFIAMRDTAFIENCTFKKNKVVGPQVPDGLIYCMASALVLKNTVIKKNEAFQYGALTYDISFINSIAPMSLTNCLVAENTTRGEASNCLLIRGHNSLSILNSTVAENLVTGNFTAAVYWVAFGDTMHLEIANSIFWDPINPFFTEILPANFDGSTFSITYNDINNTYLPGTGNVDLDPQFKAANNFHLQTSSPCVNAGTNMDAPAYDLDGKPRPLPANTNVDMGCYERNQEDARLENDEAAIARNILLYPNPASSGSLLQFYVEHDCMVNVSLITPDGKEIKTFANEEMNGGDHELELDLRSVSPGFYFVILKMGSQTFTVKQILQ